MATEQNDKAAGSRKAVKPTPWIEPVAPSAKTVTFTDRKPGAKLATGEKKG